MVKTDQNKEAREYDPFYDPIYNSVRTVIGFCQGIFKVLPETRYRWSPNLEDTKITITGAYPLKAETINQRPAIVVTHSQSQILNTSMNSFEKERFITGNTVHRDLISTNIIINCVATTGPEASSIAWFVSSNIKALRPLLQRMGPFTQIGQSVSLGGETPPGALLRDSSDTSAITVPIMLPVFIPHKWEVLNPAYAVDAIVTTSDTIKR